MNGNKPNKKINNYWVSYSDLLAGLLFMFVLLFVVILLQHKKSIQDQRLVLQKESEALEIKKQENKQLKLLLDEQRVILQQESEMLKAKRQENERLKLLLEEQKRELREIKAQVKDILELKKRIIELLIKEFEKNNIEVSIDPFTGALHLSSNILFDSNSDWMKQEGKEYLMRMVPVWLDILLFHPHVSPFIAEIIVEGHTDPRNTYLYNLDLSQRRALSVVKYIMSDDFDVLTNKDPLRKILTVNGRSFMDLIMVTDNSDEVDYERSRRVVFKFRLKSEEQLGEIAETLGKMDVLSE